MSINSENSYCTPGISDREVQLTGEAYFSVSTNKRIPFLVRTSDENAIEVYNTKRLHLSLGYKTPNMVFQNVA